MKTVRSYITATLAVLLFNYGLVADDYKIAVRAHKGVDVAIKKWQPTLDALTEALPEHSFTMIPILNITEITERAGKGEFDFVLTNPSSYVEISMLHGAKALVTLNNKRNNSAQSMFGSVIFTHASNREILTIKDLKGKSLMAVSEPAFGGWRVAWLEMLKYGIDPYKDLKSLSFAPGGTQPEVLVAVLSREVEVGIVRTDMLESMENEGKIDMRYLRIINNKHEESFPFFLSTGLYPEWPFSAMGNVPKDIVEQIQNTLLGITVDSDAAKVGKYVGWVAPRDYSSVKELMQQLKVGPFLKK